MKRGELKYFLMDFVDMLKEDAFEAKKNSIKNKNEKNSDFYRGIVFGYWEVFDTLKLQLLSFQINLKDVKFDFDPDKELLKFEDKNKKWPSTIPKRI